MDDGLTWKVCSSGRLEIWFALMSINIQWFGKPGDTDNDIYGLSNISWYTFDPWFIGVTKSKFVSSLIMKVADLVPND